MSLRRRLLFLLILLGSGAPAPGSTYTITNIGTLGGATTSAYAINAAGQVTGFSADAGNNNLAFLYSNGSMTAINIGGAGVGRNINASGQIEGNLSNAHLFVWTNGTTQDLGIPLGGSNDKGYGFNNVGQITGQVTLPSGQIHGFLYSPGAGGSTVDMGTMGGNPTDFSYGSSVNITGQVEGDSINAAGLDHAFIWTNGHYQDLGTLGGQSSSGISVNTAGHATGTSQTVGTVSHVFFYDGATMHDAGTLGGNFANAGAMNNLDQIVGNSLLADNTTQHAFIYTGGVMTDLNSLIPINSGWTLLNATGINDSGQILTNATNSQGQQNAFILTPTPEPGFLGILMVGTVGCLLGRRRGTFR